MKRAKSKRAPRKSGASSKQKGAAFERDICRRLSLWVTDGEKADCFWRSAMSGGRATRGLARGERLDRQAGDITAVAPEGHVLTDRFFIELKFYRDLQIDRSLLEGRGALARFWWATVDAATKHDRLAMLIAKQNRFPELVLVPPNGLRRIGPPLLQVWGSYDVYLLPTMLLADPPKK